MKSIRLLQTKKIEFFVARYSATTGVELKESKFGFVCIEAEIVHVLFTRKITSHSLQTNRKR